MSCKHFQREVLVKKCGRKRLQRKLSAPKMRSKTFAAKNFGQKSRPFNSKTFAAENFGRKIRLKIFEAQSFGQKMLSQNFTAENFGRKLRYLRFANICSAKFRLQISKFMSCKHFQREVLVKKCVRKFLEQKFLAKNRGIFDSQTCAAQNFGCKSRKSSRNSLNDELQTFSARSFGQKMRSQTFAAQIVGPKNAYKNVKINCSQKFRPKIAAFQFENVCSRKFRPKNPFRNI